VAERGQVLGEGTGDGLDDGVARRVEGARHGPSLPAGGGTGRTLQDRTRRTAKAGSRSGKSDRVWAPRLSRRSEAAATSAKATSARLASSHAAGVSAADRATERARSTAEAVRASESASRSTPAPVVMAR